MPTPFTTAPNPCRLLVIAPDDFAGALAPLMVHKNRTGMPAHLITLSQIFSPTSDPATHPLAIKKVIAEGHRNFGVAYVMLAGDASLIPVRHRSVLQGDGGSLEGMTGTYNPTDNYYANLYRVGGSTAGFSDWDGDGDGRYAEQIWGVSPVTHNPDAVDGYPHVSLGRVPAHTRLDVENYVHKLIEYEEGLRSRTIDVCSFLNDNDAGLQSRQKSDDVISFSGIATRTGAKVQRLQGNLATGETPQAGWAPFGSPQSEHTAFTTKFLVHFGHGWTTGWGIKLDSGRSLDDPHVRNWQSGTSYSYPVVMSVGCNTGQFLNCAPSEGPYRRLNPDQAYEFDFDKTARKVKEVVRGETWPWPISVPVPHAYDFDGQSSRTFAHAWLCANPTGGAIAYIGANQIHQGTAFGAHLAARFIRQVGQLNILGDIWVTAQREYFTDIATHSDRDTEFGSPRIYLCVMQFFGDPSLRLAPVIPHGVSAIYAGNRLTVFARDPQGTLTHRFYRTSPPGWGEWKRVSDGVISSRPTAVMAGDRLTIFVRNAHGTLSQNFYDPGRSVWAGWIHFEDGEISSAPHAVMAGGRLMVFARDLQGFLIHRSYDPVSLAWSGWDQVGGARITSAPSVVVSGDRINVFARGESGTLTHTSCDASIGSWTDWTEIDSGEMTAAPSAVLARDRLAVFARNEHGILTHKFYDATARAWSPWQDLGHEKIGSAPSAVMADGRLTVFALTPSGLLTHKYFDSSRGVWTSWKDFDGGAVT